MDRQNVFEFYEVEEIAVKVGVDGLQFFKLKILQFALLVQSQTYRLSDLLVSNAERHILADQVGGGSEGIHTSRGRRLAHAIEIELDGLYPSCSQREQ